MKTKRMAITVATIALIMAVSCGRKTVKVGIIPTGPQHPVNIIQYQCGGLQYNISPYGGQVYRVYCGVSPGVVVDPFTWSNPFHTHHFGGNIYYIYW